MDGRMASAVDSSTVLTAETSATAPGGRRGRESGERIGEVRAPAAGAALSD